MTVPPEPPRKPLFNFEISLGNIIIVLGLVANAYAFFIRDSSDLANVRQEMSEIRPIVAAHSVWIGSATTQLNTISSTMTSGRQEQVQQLGSVSNTLEAINTRLSRIEGKLSIE